MKLYPKCWMWMLNIIFTFEPTINIWFNISEKTKCLLLKICFIRFHPKRRGSTSWRDLSSIPTATSWMSSVQAVTGNNNHSFPHVKILVKWLILMFPESRQFLVTPRLLLSAPAVLLSSASPPEEEPGHQIYCKYPGLFVIFLVSRLTEGCSFRRKQH